MKMEKLVLVESNVEVQKIEEEKIVISEVNTNTNQKILQTKKSIKKKKPLKDIHFYNEEVEKLTKNLPNTKNIKNLKLKSKLSKDVELAVSSARTGYLHDRFFAIPEGYIKRKEEVEKNHTPERNITIEGELPDEEVDKKKEKHRENEKAGKEIQWLQQKNLYEYADVGTQKKVFELNLSLGPYECNYSRNGKYLLATGERGHISLFDTQQLEALCELQVQETIRCNTVLHNHKLFAVSQKKYIYLYDNTGMEINCIKDILYTHSMQFLHHHLLLVTIGEFGELVYQDISMGNIVSRKKTKKGSCSIMKQNKETGVIYLGHKNGHVTLWTPNMQKPVVDLFCHYTPLSSIGVHGNYMISASVDCSYKLWDLRKLEFVKSSREHNIINHIEISDNSIVGFGMNSHFRTYSNFFTEPKIHIKHNVYGSKIHSIAFQPFEDVCCIGSHSSIQTILVPQAGIANIDTFVNNPYETKTQVRENEIKLLLDKLPPDTIRFTQNEIGKINPFMKKKIQKKKLETKNLDDNKEHSNETEKKEENQTDDEEEEDDKSKIEKKKKKKKKKGKQNLLHSNVPKYLRKSYEQRKKEREE